MLFISSEGVSPAVPDCKGDRILPLLLCGTEPVHYIWPERLPCQSPAFSYVTADREIPVLAHVALAWLLEHSELVAERVPYLPT